MDLAIYNHDGETKTIHLMEVDPEIYHVATETSYWEKRRAYFKPTVAGTYYLKATLKGSAYQNPTYTVRVRKADDYAHIQKPGLVESQLVVQFVDTSTPSTATVNLMKTGSTST